MWRGSSGTMRETAAQPEKTMSRTDDSEHFRPVVLAGGPRRVYVARHAGFGPGNTDREKEPVMSRTARRPAVALDGRAQAPSAASSPPSVATSVGQGKQPEKDPRRRATTSPRERPEPGAWALDLTEGERRFLAEDLADLTEREREVVFAVCEGGQNHTVAERLFIALPTLRTHLMRINQKLGARSKGDVVRFVAGRLLVRYRSGKPMEPGEALGGRSESLSRENEGKP